MTTKHAAVWVAFALVAACGGSREDDDSPAAPPAPPSLLESAFTESAPVAIDQAAAAALPADTAVVLTLADLPRLIARIGLGDDVASVLRALRHELTAWLGFDLLDADAAGRAGVNPASPVTLAWLDGDGIQLALVVAVADARKLEQALGERPALIRGDRALIPIGGRADTREALEGVTSGSSLAASGKLGGAGATGFGADAALYADGRAFDLGARTIVLGLSLREDSLRAVAAAQFNGTPPEPAEWGDRVARRLGAEHARAELPYAHQLSRELELGTTDPTSRFAMAPVLTHLGVPDAALGEKLGFAVMAGTTDVGRLVYYGGVAFNGALAAELGPIVAGIAARARARLRARNAENDLARRAAGILGKLDSGSNGAFASLTGTADFSSGLDDLDLRGGLIGNDADDMQGGFGFGASGVGPGGGGTGSGGLGTGSYGTIGHGRGTGVGTGSGGMRSRARKTPAVRIGAAQATGDLDKNIIRRYIRRKLPRIKYCYEKELLVSPDLAGKVTASFVIGASGAVTSSSADGVNDAVSACVAGVIRAIQFPAPKGGGVVTVRYPFIFRPQ